MTIEGIREMIAGLGLELSPELEKLAVIAYNERMDALADEVNKEYIPGFSLCQYYVNGLKIKV